MTEINNNNRLISEFMGPSELFNDSKKGKIMLYCKPGHTTPNCEVDDLKYHSSWDWIMPVYLKIQEIDIKNSDLVFKEYFNNIIVFNNIRWVNESCVGVIRWYNQQTEGVVTTSKQP